MSIYLTKWVKHIVTTSIVFFFFTADMTAGTVWCIQWITMTELKSLPVACTGCSCHGLPHRVPPATQLAVNHCSVSLRHQESLHKTNTVGLEQLYTVKLLKGTWEGSIAHLVITQRERGGQESRKAWRTGIREKADLLVLEPVVNSKNLSIWEIQMSTLIKRVFACENLAIKTSVIVLNHKGMFFPW